MCACACTCALLFGPSPTLLSTFQTDKSGCAWQKVDVSRFGPNELMYMDRFDLSAELEESGTGR